MRALMSFRWHSDNDCSGEHVRGYGRKRTGNGVSVCEPHFNYIIHYGPSDTFCILNVPN